MIQNAWMPLQAWGEIILISCSIFALLSVVCVIFYNADALGNFFIPILLCYLILLTVIGVAIYHWREKRNLYTTLGPELYYLLYPQKSAGRKNYNFSLHAGKSNYAISTVISGNKHLIGSSDFVLYHSNLRNTVIF